MDRYIVYKHTSPSGKVYIGITKQTANGRWKNGLGYKSSPHFWSAIQKYGWDNFKHEVILDGLNREDACLQEKKLIAESKAMDREFGYNDKSGGETGSALSVESRKKISVAQKKFYADHPEARKAASIRAKGYRHTDEAKMKMSAAAKSRHYALTDDWKMKIGQANRSRIMSDDILREKNAERCRKNGLSAARAVVQLSKDDKFIAKYESAHEAERKTGIRNGNIAKCCKGTAKTANGYKWRYADLYNSSSETA